MINIFNILLAALGLGFLIFIHELGHYWMARRTGMTVEVFSIGFGKPFYSWERKGVKWQLCYLPFGGYVRIAGMEKKGYLEPYEIPDGYYGKKPWARIKVAAIGPIVNLVFALFAFSLLWICGGREKPFSEYTRLIGWVDPCSGLSEAKVSPGDQILELDHKPFHSFHDVLYATMLDEINPTISGYRINYLTGNKLPFSYAFPLPAHLKGMDRLQAVLGSFGPAGYLIATDNPQGVTNDSGIQLGERLIWADGKYIFSRNELSETINEPKALLTVKRGSEFFVTRVDRVKFSDLRLTPSQKSEIQDWQHDATLKVRPQDLFFISYFLNSENRVLGPLSFLNAQSNEQSPCMTSSSAGQVPLAPKDQIVAVDGIGVKTPSELLKQLQTRHIQIIVQKEDTNRPLLWKDADVEFACNIDYKAADQIISTIGTDHPIQEMGQLRLLNPVVPKPLSEMPLSDEMRTKLESLKIKSNEQEAEGSVEKSEETEKMMLGLALRDRMVNYNPSPFTLFTNVFRETWRTLIALVSGILSPKWLTGPVGMVQVMHHSWSVGAKEAIYWLAVISMNLGILNFLPIPVLDGGHICFSLWEVVTKRRIKAKTMERLIIPFILLLITLFIYLTYHDIVRLIGHVF
jgi:regulator of sigma E protease